MGPHARGVGYLPAGKSEEDILHSPTKADNNDNHKD